MATLAIYYDPKDRITLDHSRMPRDVSAACLHVEEPEDDEHLEALAQQLARLLLTQTKAA